ncbi:uncharacterized protein LOC133720390 [Rosa rugosa]|uniref:uncharacterized protein LOC133720390 n=1 Tax=Rosa rugosa TaxID=74645 RepID=UPI002B40456C|nr:uncharacterized protein LOC133720390 [Rosa rugosa]
MSMTTMGVAGNMGIPELRQILKERYRIANNMKSCSAEMKETKNSSLFGSLEYSLSQRLIDESKALMPEMINILDKTNNNDHQKPTKATKQNSGVDLKLQRAKKVKESRDYSFLLSETSEVPKISKASPPMSIPKADGNGIPKKSHDKASSLKPKKSGDDNNKSKVSSAKSESFSKDSVLVSGSESLKSRPRENMVTKSQVSSAKRSLNPKQAELCNTKVMPKKEGPCLKKKMIKKRRVEEDLGDDGNVDFSSLIQDIMGRRGKRQYRNYGDDGDDRAMVSGFIDILKEERRSAEIARKEDAIEALRLEQEAKEERLSIAKKQKLKN